MSADGTGRTDGVAVEEIVGSLEELGDDAGATAEGAVADTRDLLAAASERGLIESEVRQLRPSDAAEAFVGSVVFAAPLLVEGGVHDIAAHLVGNTVAGAPVYLLANVVFVVLMTYALLEWTGQDREDAERLFGTVPLRVPVILLVSFVVAALLMAVWGRLGDLRPPDEAVARVVVVWTVGSLGAALGDILAGESTPTDRSGEKGATPAVAPRRDSPRATPADRPPAEMTDGELVAAIHEQFDRLATTVEDPDRRREVRRLKERTLTAALDDGFGDHIRKYTGRDVAESFVGSVFFSIPFLVEGGVFEVADFFLSFRVGLFPVVFLVNAAFVLAMVGLLVYWAGPQNVTVSRPIFGIVPRRLVGTSIVAFVTAAALMTMWGRVGGWEDPVVALARISVVWTVASFGAALGDVLPGESSGDDINDDLADLGELVEDLRDGS